MLPYHLKGDTAAILPTDQILPFTDLFRYRYMYRQKVKSGTKASGSTKPLMRNIKIATTVNMKYNNWEGAITHYLCKKHKAKPCVLPALPSRSNLLSEISL